MRKCNKCGFPKELSEFYSQEKVNSKGEKYTYYRPDCKECAKKVSREWQINNPEQRDEIWRKYNKSEKGKKLFYNFGKKYREDGRYREWQNKNKDKLVEYRETREMNKKHEISDEEWIACKSYFNHKCAYCGIDEDKAIELYSQQFHKEHVDHDGANDLSNCVPSCKSCNSKKRKKEFEDWYNENNKLFDSQRLEKIIKWLDTDYLNFIKG